MARNFFPSFMQACLLNCVIIETNSVQVFFPSWVASDVSLTFPFSNNWWMREYSPPPYHCECTIQATTRPACTCVCVFVCLCICALSGSNAENCSCDNADRQKPDKWWNLASTRSVFCAPGSCTRSRSRVGGPRRPEGEIIMRCILHAFTRTNGSSSCSSRRRLHRFSQLCAVWWTTKKDWFRSGSKAGLSVGLPISIQRSNPATTGEGERSEWLASLFF